MSKKRESKEQEAKVVFDVGLGGIFKGIENILNIASRLKEAGGEIRETKEFRIKGLGDKAKGVFGFSIKTLAPEGLKVEPFGNIRETKAGPVVEEVGEPIVDVFEEGQNIRVIAEMPGVSETDIHYEIKGDILTLSSERGRKYHKEVLLPAPVKEDEIKANYKNGIFELQFIKA